MTPKELHQTLAGGGPDPLYLIYGEEDFLVEECVQAVVHHALDEGSRQFNLDILYGSKSSVQEVIAHATAFPMMGERRVTIVRELASWPTPHATWPRPRSPHAPVSPVEAESNGCGMPAALGSRDSGVGR